MEQFPPNIGCKLMPSYAPELKPKVQGFGGAVFLERDTFVVEIRIDTQEKKRNFFDWWEQNLDYGTATFLVTLPIFGRDIEMEVYIKEFLAEKYRSVNISTVSLTLIRVDGHGSIGIDTWEAVTNNAGETVVDNADEIVTARKE